MLGHLHDVRAQIALLGHDAEACERHLNLMEQAYRPTGIPNLMQLVSQRRKALKRPDSAGGATDDLPTDAHLTTRMHLILTSATGIDERVEAALRAVLRLTGADRGFVVVVNATSPIVSFGDAAADEVAVAWAQTAPTEDERTSILSEGEGIDDAPRALDGVYYDLTPLYRDRLPVAALVLGSTHARPTPPPHDVVEALSKYASNASSIRPRNHVPGAASRGSA